jgi:protein O-GlcNAc transferase
MSTIMRNLQINAEEASGTGLHALQQGEISLAVSSFKAAADAKPEMGLYASNYIHALISNAQTTLARRIIDDYQKRGVQDINYSAIRTRLDQTDPTHNDAGYLMAFINEGRYETAESVARKFIVRFPSHGFGWKVLASIFIKKGLYVEALPVAQRAVELQPNQVDACNNLGIVLKELGRLHEAEDCIRRALVIEPDFAEAHNTLSTILTDQHRLQEAEASSRYALQLKPNYSLATNNLGTILMEQRRYAQAVVCLRRALALEPHNAYSHNNLGNALQLLGNIAAADDCYRKALQLDPDYADAHSNLLLNLNYDDATEPSTALEDARTYGQTVSRKATKPFTQWQCPMPPRRLRVGLVSGDLREHAVGFFLEGLLQHLDPARIELYAYPTVPNADDMTDRIKRQIERWRPLSGLSDEGAAQLIHQDGIHILIDLAGHTRHNRLPVFAWKPAPVQATWLGYFATTGVTEMDFLIADEWTLPQAQEVNFTEKIIRLPNTRLCFTPPAVDIEVSSLPALTNGFITFGCFSNLAKVNDAVVACWAKVLKSVPNSRLLLKAKQLREESASRSLRERFACHQIAEHRLLLEGPSPREEYLAAYHRVDVILDGFPFPGGTTSAESLWMGVPVLTLAGESLISRQGLGLLMNVGLPDWISTNVDDYVCLAATHSGDLPRLARLRAGLRERALQSPLFDACQFAVQFEATLHQMWNLKQSQVDATEECDGAGAHLS